MAEAVEQAAPSAKPKGRMMLYLAIGLALVVTPVATWFASGLFQKPVAGKQTKAPKTDWVKLEAPPNMAIPLIRTQIVFIEANESLGHPAFVTPTNSQAARPIEKMTIRLADTKETHYVVAQFHLVGKNTDLLITRMNQRTNAAALYDETKDLLSKMTLQQVRAPSFRTLFRGRIKVIADRILGSNVVQEVLLSDFITQ
jgi:flagellar basal body-associated protein FliL